VATLETTSSQVIHVCSYITGDLINRDKVDITKEYHFLFKHDENNDNFNCIHKYWKLIYDQFMTSDDKNGTPDNKTGIRKSIALL
jgi:hypothetical protein